MDAHEKLAHEKLLNSWAQQVNHQGHCFIQDGVIEQRRWDATTPKVLFLLKEARHDGPESSWDLREFIRENNGPYGPALKNAAYWSYAIHHIARGNLPGFPVEKSTLDEAAELFLSSAVVNIKKSRGTAHSSYDDLAQHGQTDGALIKKQIELIDPDIVICGYTWPHVKHVWQHEAQAGGYDGVWRVGRRVFIDFWHPAYPIPDDLKYYALSCLLQNSRVLSKAALAA
jgi:hypothetical protein